MKPPNSGRLDDAPAFAGCPPSSPEQKRDGVIVGKVTSMCANMLSSNSSRLRDLLRCRRSATSPAYRRLIDSTIARLWRAATPQERLLAFRSATRRKGYVAAKADT